MVEHITITPEEEDALLHRLREQQLLPEDYHILEGYISMHQTMRGELTKAECSVKRLQKVFNIETEKSSNILPDKPDTALHAAEQEQPADSTKDDDVDATKQLQKKPRSSKGNGRRGHKDFTNAETFFVSHQTYTRGDRCPQCIPGKLYPIKKPQVFIHIKGRTPFYVTKYALETLRCNACGITFTAAPPAHTKNKKYDATTVAMLAVLRYGSGFPMYRISKLQSSFDIPLPVSTQWDVLNNESSVPKTLYNALIIEAAAGDVIHNDDTRMRVMELKKENKKDPDRKRKGIFTSGCISRMDNRDIALYYTGRNTAGENLEDLMKKRDPANGPPIQMCDASKNNEQSSFAVILSNCLTHGRRHFVDIIDAFPKECIYIIEELGTVYRNDDMTKKLEMNKQERLEYHQKHSTPIMESLHAWMMSQFEEKKVEPNSELGRAFSYMLKHWEKLTRFLHVAGAPLDNNIVERMLKKAILHRKNSLFYQTTSSAHIGDAYMSLIHTCELNRVDPFDYIIEIVNHSIEVRENPHQWLPWNYHLQVAAAVQRTQPA